MDESVTSQPELPFGETAEEWRPVAGFVHYEVSNLGRVRSIDRAIMCRNRWGGERARHYRGRILKPGAHNFGYGVVSLFRDRVPHQRYVHELVAEAFIGERPPGMHVCHGPSREQDNRASELRYDTQAGNAADRARDGTETRGTRHPQAKLNEAAVLDIRQRGATVPQAALAAEYGVSFSAVSQVIRRKTWTHVP